MNLRDLVLVGYVVGRLAGAISSLDQSKNVTVKTFHNWPGSVHEYIFLALGGAGDHVTKHEALISS